MVCDKIVVLDVDKHPNSPDGHVALAELEAEHGKIETWLVHTPQNGRHYYFSQPKDGICSTLKRDDAGLELRGAAGHTSSCLDRAPHMAPTGGIPSFTRDNVRRAVLPAYVQAFVAGTPMRRATGLAKWPTPLGRWPVASPRNPAPRANGGAGQLANPYREMASGQLPRTALAEWFETEVHEGAATMP